MQVGRRGPSESGPVLDGAALLALQLASRGYTPAQIARLTGRGEPEVAVLASLAGAVRVLGVLTLPEAINEARRRGLIV